MITLILLLLTISSVFNILYLNNLSYQYMKEMKEAGEYSKVIESPQGVNVEVLKEQALLTAC